MGTLKLQQELNNGVDELAGWDPRKEDYMDRQNSTILGCNFTRTNNLARNKETVREPHGLYVRNIPKDISEDSLFKIFSEHGKVLHVFIGKPRSEFVASEVTWGLVKVESMNDAVAMISALNMKQPLRLKVELALTEEERTKRRQEKEMERNNQREMEELVSKRMSASDVKQKSCAPPSELPAEFNNGMGRGKKLSSLAKGPSEKSVGNHQDSSVQVEDCGGANTLQSPSCQVSAFTPVKEPPREKVVVETNIGNVSVSWRQPRPCIAEGCGTMGKLRCSICKAFYCSKECQIDDWFCHSKYCKEPPPLEEFNLSVSRASKVNETRPDLSVSKVSKTNEAKGESHLKISHSINLSTPTDGLDKLNENLSLSKDLQDGTSSNKDDLAIQYLGKRSSKKTVDNNCMNNFVPNESNGQLKFNHRRSRLAGMSQGNMRRPFQKDENRSPGNHTPPPPSLQGEKFAERNVFDQGPKSASGCLMTAELAKQDLGESASLKYGLSKNTVASTLKFGSSVGSGVKPPASNCTDVLNHDFKPPVIIKTNLEQKTATDSVESIKKLSLAIDFESLPCLVDQIEVNSNLIGLITVKESCEHFIVLLMVESACLLLNEGNSTLEKSICDPKFEPVIGSLVAAKSLADSIWYRACVYGRDKEEQFDVLYIDFGNKEKVKVIKSLPMGELSSLPGLAMVAKYHGKMSDSTQKILEKVIVADGQVTMKVIGKKAKSIKVALLENESGTALANFILRPWYTTLPHNKASTEFSDVKSLSEGSDECLSNANNVTTKPKHELSLSPSKFIEISPQCILDASETCPAKSSTPNKFWYCDLCHIKLQPNKDYSVIPVWVGDDNALYVHLVSEESQTHTQELLQEINKHCEKAVIPSSLEVGELVCGFVACDSAWYRAEVKEANQSHIVAHFVDFGNSDSIAWNQLRVFNVQLMKPPVMAVRIELAGIVANDINAKKQLLTLVGEGQVLRMRSVAGNVTLFQMFDKEILLNELMCPLNIKKLENSANSQELVENTTSQTDKLKCHSIKEHKPKNHTPFDHSSKDHSPLDHCISTPSDTESPKNRVPMYENLERSSVKLGKDVEVVVVHTNGPHNIFIVARDEIKLYDDLEKLNAAIDEYCNSLNGSLYRPQQGELCLAKFKEDGLWYRAACLKPDLEFSFVIFIDYGNIEEVAMTDLRQIVDAFMKIPCIALHSVLKGVSENDIRKEAKDRLAQLLPQNTPTRANVEVDENGNYVIDVPSVSSTLVKEGLVKAE